MAEQGQYLLNNDFTEIRHFLIPLVIILSEWLLLKGGSRNSKL